MPYLTCPDCHIATQVGDEAVKFTCLGCFAEIAFETCGYCGHPQSVAERWEKAFTCGKCMRKVDLPMRRSYATSTQARWVKGYGYPYPKF